MHLLLTTTSKQHAFCAPFLLHLLLLFYDVSLTCCGRLYITTSVFTVNGWDNIVVIVTRHGLDGPGSNPRIVEIFPRPFRPALVSAHLPIK